MQALLGRQNAETFEAVQPGSPARRSKQQLAQRLPKMLTNGPVLRLGNRAGQHLSGYPTISHGTSPLATRQVPDFPLPQPTWSE